MREYYAFKGFCRGIPKGLGFLLLLAVAFLSYVYFMQNTPHLSPCFTGLERLCLSIVSGVVFYLIVVRSKEWRDRRAVAPHLYGRTKRIIGNAMLFFGAMEREITGTQSNARFPDADTLDRQCAQLRIATPAERGATFLHGDGSLPIWIDQLDYLMRETNAVIDDMFGKIPYMEVGYVALLTSIHDCALFQKIAECKRHSPNWPIQDSATLSVFYGDMKAFKDLIENLDAYSNRRFQEHGGIPSP